MLVHGNVNSMVISSALLCATHRQPSSAASPATLYVSGFEKTDMNGPILLLLYFVILYIYNYFFICMLSVMLIVCYQRALTHSASNHVTVRMEHYGFF